jgi:hypothetical protein
MWLNPEIDNGKVLNKMLAGREAAARGARALAGKALAFGGPAGFDLAEFARRFGRGRFGGSTRQSRHGLEGFHLSAFGRVVEHSDLRVAMV